MITTDSGLQIEEIKRTDNCEPKAEIGSLLSVHYTGYFVNGTKFDSSYDRNEPLTLILGNCPTTLIRGWVEGLQGMCDGEKRKLIIPPQLGYGEKGKGKINLLVFVLILFYENYSLYLVVSFYLCFCVLANSNWPLFVYVFCGILFITSNISICLFCTENVFVCFLCLVVFTLESLELFVVFVFSRLVRW